MVRIAPTPPSSGASHRWAPVKYSASIPVRKATFFNPATTIARRVASGGDARLALGIERRRGAGEHRDVAESGVCKMIPDDSRFCCRKSGRDQDGAWRETRDTGIQRMRRGAGVDDDVIVAARERVERNDKPIRADDRSRIESCPASRDDLNARETIARDDLSERRSTVHEIR